MSALAEIQRRIQSTSALIAEHERAIASSPPDLPNPLSINIRGLQKLKRRLERQFDEIAQEEELEVYRYRILDEDSDRTPLSAVAETWKGFQDVFSSIVHAVQESDPTYSKDEVVAAFGYGYTFAGSLGVVVTLPRGYKNLMGKSALEDSTQILFDLIEGGKSQDLAKRLGRSPIATVNTWIETHIRNRLGIGLEWKGPSGSRLVEVLYRDLHVLQSGLEKTTIEKAITISGVLVAVDTTSKTFKFRGDDQVIYEGGSGSTINAKHEASVPSRYTATITQITNLIAAHGQKPETRLDKLQKIPKRKGLSI